MWQRLVYIKLKLLPSGGENSTISVQLEAILGKETFRSEY